MTSLMVEPMALHRMAEYLKMTFYTGQSKNYTITSYSAGEEVNNIEAWKLLLLS